MLQLTHLALVPHPCVSESGQHWFRSWWRHQMKTFFALLAIWAGKSSVTDEFSAQRPVTRSFDVFCDMRLNKRLSTQSWNWWYETPSCPLWRHYSAPSHYLNQCGVIINLTLTDKRQWNFDQNIKLFIHENASENFVCEMAAILSRERWVKVRALQWRHNEHDSVPNHQSHGCLPNGLFRQRLKLRVTGLCEGNSPVTGEFPTERASNPENVSIWWRHHGVDKFLYPTQSYGM